MTNERGEITTNTTEIQTILMVYDKNACQQIRKSGKKI